MGNAYPTLAVRDVFQSCPLHFPPLPVMGIGCRLPEHMVCIGASVYVYLETDILVPKHDRKYF